MRHQTLARGEWTGGRKGNETKEKGTIKRDMCKKVRRNGKKR